MIKVTMEQLIDFRNADGFFNSANLPLKAAYKLNKIRKAADKEGEFYSEKFQEIINDYAKKDSEGNVMFSDDGEQIMIQDGKIEECNKALADLQDLEVEIDNFGLTVDDLGEDVACTPDELEALMPFLD